VTGNFEVGAVASLRALHRLPWLEGPEGELHAHDYRIEVIVERAHLDERGMVCDLDVLQRALGETVGALDGKDLDVVVEHGEAEAVTVEILASYLHERLWETVAQEGAEVLSVRVWESGDAFGGYRGSVRTSSE
jgi:6-pyruvoyl-tetrahydropterin synthase